MPHIVLVVPARPRVGLTTVCLGLVRALDRKGVRVTYAKPITVHGEDRSIALVKLVARLTPPAPIPRARVDELLADGDDQTLMEAVVAVCGAAAEGADVLVVEGMVPETGNVYSTRVNALMMKALDSELVLVGSAREQDAAGMANAVAIAARGFGPLDEGRTVGCVLNRVCGQGVVPASFAGLKGQGGPLCGGCGECQRTVHSAQVATYRSALEAEKLRPLAIIPCAGELAAPRVKDVASELGATVLFAGDMAHRRIKGVILCAMMARNAIRVFKPDVLVIAPGDRDDILMAAALAVAGGTPLAGLLLSGGIEPDPGVLTLCKPALDAGLPILQLPDLSYDAAARVAAMNQEIPIDDIERVEASANFVADQVDVAWLASLAASPRTPRLSPPAFRYRLVEAARAAQKRILLPEGSEPRTIAAAAIVEERGIARCVLMGDPDEIRERARKQGVTLPRSIEILDAASAAPHYVAPLVERRRHKGLLPETALAELADPIMVGTMMLTLGEADGLVSGAVHSTAHTIRPALQLLRGTGLVSSVFFMCLPDQVLVFGDCAVNPNPTAVELANIAVQSADSARAFGITPRVAMLSYSTGASAAGADVEKVKRATELARVLRPDLAIDGPMQYDAAIMPEVARHKMPNSLVAGHATVFIFPDLNSGNMTYKAVQRAANVVSMGPMLQGLARPVNDLSRGCLVEDIVFTIALTAIQAEQAGEVNRCAT
jgi:phosphate acetyltransferase